MIIDMFMFIIISTIIVINVIIVIIILIIIMLLFVISITIIINSYDYRPQRASRAGGAVVPGLRRHGVRGSLQYDSSIINYMVYYNMIILYNVYVIGSAYVA